MIPLDKDRMNPEVEHYFDRLSNWKVELSSLRRIILDCGVVEEYKWNSPCYSVGGKNILIIGTLKDCCTLSFFKGAALKDDEQILELPGPNTQSARVIRFNENDQILEIETTLKRYIFEAIELEQSGVLIARKPDDLDDYPKELLAHFELNPAFQSSFMQLTKGRQRGYLLHFNGAKQSKTKTARIEKYASRIFDGMGIHDCTCGLSKRMPNCDGSHNQRKT